MKNILYIIFLYFVFCSGANAAEILETINVDDFTIQVIEKDCLAENECFFDKKKREVTILKNNQSIYESSQNINWKEGDVKPVGWKDINGNGLLNIILQTYSKGAHCCSNYYILEIQDDKINLLNKIEVGDYHITFEDIDEDGIDELITLEPHFSYWNCSFRACPLIEVVMSFNGIKYVPNTDLMKRYQQKIIGSDAVMGERTPIKKLLQRAKISRETLEEEAQVYRIKINKLLKKTSTSKVEKKEEPKTAELDIKKYFDEVRQRKLVLCKSDVARCLEEENINFWYRMLELIYSGRYNDALWYFDKVWEDGALGKKEFAFDFFQCKLPSSAYWNEIAQMNNIETWQISKGC